MDIKAARRVSVYKQLGGERHGHVMKNNKVCSYWLQGRCSRNPCRFLHPELSPIPQPFVQSHSTCEDHSVTSRLTWRNPNFSSSKNAPKCGADSGGKSSYQEGQPNVSKIERDGGKSTQKTQQKLCKFWVMGNCVKSDNCGDLHSWFYGNGFTMLAKLEGHNKAVIGISLPSCCDKLFSASNDKSVRIWDCNTGQCAEVVKLEGTIGTLVSEGPWVFVGLSNAVKAWNIQSNVELTLNGPVGQVYALVVGNDMLFAGTEDGTILAWKSSCETSCPEVAATLKGHSRVVLSLFVGANRLYSGSMDKTIRVWDLQTLQCIQTLDGHANAVMSVLCWDSYLISGSLDSTIKVWAATESGTLEVVYERMEDHGVLALCGIYDADAKPILLCSCNDNAVRLYDLPTFIERGRIFAKREVRAIQIGPGGLFFTGDATGQVFVWKLLGDPSAAAS
ncbi:unnamed protein product [Ilex paraguariensis]|uniref:C3H1-type domain-containing protein n=1 Tax=Ilex paraguariensis TaxID=185542 RepID=A0ABC8RS15_9AQUA